MIPTITRNIPDVAPVVEGFCLCLCWPCYQRRAAVPWFQRLKSGPAKNLVKTVSPSSHFWLGNSQRNFYGTGPWSDGPLEIVWEAETGLISGRLHPDPWGGTSWPGQPAVDSNRVYFPSADGNVYCIDARDGGVIWKFKAKDSFKATPTVAGDRIIASGLDHHVYCINARDGTVIWDFQTGFEVDGSVAVLDGRIYFGSEDGFSIALISPMVL